MNNSYYSNFQSYLRREYNIKYRPQCTSIPQTTIDYILNSNIPSITSSTYYNTDNSSSSDNGVDYSQSYETISSSLLLLSHQLALATTYATMKNDQLHFVLAQQDSKQEEKEQQQHQSEIEFLREQLQSTKDQQLQSKDQLHQQELQDSKEQLHLKDQQIAMLIKLLDQRLQSRDQQIIMLMKLLEQKQ